MSSESLRNMNDDTSGEFGGLGIEITMEGGLVKVLSAPTEQAPHYRIENIKNARVGRYFRCHRHAVQNIGLRSRSETAERTAGCLRDPTRRHLCCNCRVTHASLDQKHGLLGQPRHTPGTHCRCQVRLSETL